MNEIGNLLFEFAYINIYIYALKLCTSIRVYIYI